MKLMEVNLIPLFMLRLAGLDLNECPKFLAKKPGLQHHSVFFPKDDIRLTFKIEGIISYLPTWPLDTSEISNCNHLVLTPESPIWDPHTFIYQDKENLMMKYRGEVKEKANQDHRILAAEINRSVPLVILDTRALLEALEVNTSYHKIQALTFSKVWKGASPNDLMERWGIGLDTANNTICATTQLCVKGAKPTLNRRFNNNDRMLRYPRITSDLFINTFFASKKSWKSSRGYSCCQLFVAPFGHIMGIPMIDKKGHNVAIAMKIYFKYIGFPLDLISDGAREQVQGEAIRLANQSG